MKKTFTIAAVLILCFISNATFAAKKETKPTDLTAWKGYNVPIMKLYQGEDGAKFFAAVKKHAPKGYTLKMVKDYFNKMFALKFKSMKVVDGDTIIIDDKLKGDYAYVGKLTTKWDGYDIKWEIFKTDSKEMIEAGYKYFLLMPFHQHNKKALRHAHFRYGNANFDYLATDPSVQKWWPTVYQPATTDEAKIMKSIIKGARLQASMLPKLK